MNTKQKAGVVAGCARLASWGLRFARHRTTGTFHSPLCGAVATHPHNYAESMWPPLEQDKMCACLARITRRTADPVAVEPVSDRLLRPIRVPGEPRWVLEFAEPRRAPLCPVHREFTDASAVCPTCQEEMEANRG